MKTHAYNELYLEEAMNNLGSMLDCAVNVAHCDLLVFYGMFLSSGIASEIEVGNPRYVVGMSGMELMQLVFRRSSDKVLPDLTYHPFERTPEYWAGWVLAYYQWHNACSFSFIQKNGLDIRTLVSLYGTLHEVDLSRFVLTADAIVGQHLALRKNMLKTLRKQAKITQRQLADLSGVSLRMIQAYEQGDQDIRKAEAQTVLALSHALACRPEMIV